MVAFGQGTQKYPYPTSSQPAFPKANILTRKEKVSYYNYLELWLQISVQISTELS